MGNINEIGFTVELHLSESMAIDKPMIRMNVPGVGILGAWADSEQDLLETVTLWAQCVQNAIDNERYDRMDEVLSSSIDALNLHVDEDVMCQLARMLVDKGVTPP